MISVVSPRRPFLSSCSLLLGHLAIIALLGSLTGFAAYQSHLHYQHQAEISANNLAQLLGKQISGVVEKADVSLRTISHQLESQLARGSIDAQAANALLAHQKQLLPDILDLRIASPSGSITHSTGTLPDPSFSVAEDDFFLQLRDDSRAGLALGGPRISRISHQGITVLARRLNRPDGSFAGIVYAVLTTDHLREMLSAVNLGPNGMASVRTADFSLIDRFPPLSIAPLSDNKGVSMEYLHNAKKNPEAGTFIAANPVDETERTIAYRKIPGLPWYIAVGLAPRDYLDAWKAELAQLAGLMVLFSLVILWLLRSANKAVRRQQAASQLLQEAVDSVAIGISIFDPQGRLVICNEAIGGFFPANRDILIPGARFQDIVEAGVARGWYPEAADNPRKWIEDRIERHRAADGKPFEQKLHDGRQLLIIEYRTPSGHIVSNRIDISELSEYRNRLERLVEERTAALEESTAQLRIFVEQAPIATAMFDRNMLHLAASRRWVNERHTDNAALIGRGLYELYPDIPERWRQVHRAALAGVPQEKAEDCWVRANGACHWKRWTVYPWLDQHGEIGGIIIAAEDITDRKMAEQRLVESEIRFRSTFEQAAVGLVHVSLDGQLLRFNDKYLAILGYERYELQDVNVLSLLHPDDVEPGSAALAQLCQRNGKGYSVERRYVRKNGAVIWCYLTVTLVRSASGEPDYFMVVVEDIQPRKEVEIALTEERENRHAILARQVAERTAELEAVNKQLEGFIYASSHDLKGPLGRINSFSSLLETNYRDRLEGDGLMFLDFIRENATRLTKLIDDLLRHAHIDQQASNLQPLDLAACLEAVMEEMAGEIRDCGAHVRIHVPAIRVLADSHGLSQVLRNLLGNALKYSAGGPEATIEIGGQEQDGCFRLWIRDNGIGFKMEYHDKIFEIFRRLHTYAEYPGTGVGLALVKRAMERIGGRVWADSAPGQGATFYLEFPTATAACAGCDAELASTD